MPDERSDEQLMMDVSEGDVDAFGILVERHHQRALNLAYRLSGDADVSKDFAQESFMRIFKSARRYEPRARFTTFLYTVVHNVVVEGARRARRRREVSLADVTGASTGGTEVDPTPAAISRITTGSTAHPDPPDVSLERKEMRRRLREALAMLPDELRHAFVLSEMEGLRYREVADICGCPEGTIASRKHKAVEQLRLILRPYDPKERT